MVTVLIQYRSESKFLNLDAKNHPHPGSNYQNHECAIRRKNSDGAVNLKITLQASECFVLTSVVEPELTEKSRCVTGPPIGVKFKYEPGSRTVEHVGNVCKPTAQKSWPRGVLVHFWPLQMKKKFQEVTTLTTETGKKKINTISMKHSEDGSSKFFRSTDENSKSRNTKSILTNILFWLNNGSRVQSYVSNVCILLWYVRC